MSGRSEANRQRLVGLIWVYFVLLIAEGALRKWVVPEYSNALLIVRDPVAAAIIVFGMRDGFLPIAGAMRGLAFLGAAFVVLSGLQAALGYVRSGPLMAFGLRTYFLHPPLIFVMARVLDARSLRRLLLATLILSVPIAGLMVEQFQSGPQAWINTGAGQGGRQIATAMGRIRPSGPFSFVTGPVSFFSLVFAYLLASHFGRHNVPAMLRWGGWASVLVAIAVSGSRSIVAGLILVAAATFAAVVLRPKFVTGIVRAVAAAAIVGTVVWSFGVVQQGADVLNARFTEAGGAGDLVQRSTASYMYAKAAWVEAPLLGLGLGLGTNAGAALIGAGVFHLGEDEWTRVIFEAGPVLGVAYLAWRFWIAILAFRLSARIASAGYVLPLALFGACASNLVMGQWGQPTTQGFAVWVAGLCLASCRVAAVSAGNTGAPISMSGFTT
jgi:hypothetical protein